MSPLRIFVIVGAVAIGFGYACLDYTIERLTR